MLIVGIVLFTVASTVGLFSLGTPWLENVAVFLYSWAVAFILLGMLPKKGVDTDSEAG
ncbi:hypothetical protein SEA_FRANCOB_235 [Streptomyces phage Francob]